MEVLLAIVLEVLWWLLEIALEILLQMIGALLVDLLGHRFNKSSSKVAAVRPWVAALGYLIAGGLIGALSLLFFPVSFIKLEWLRWLNLALTPLAAGLMLAWVGSWRRQHDKSVIRLESFFYGAAFALAMTLVRFLGATQAI